MESAVGQKDAIIKDLLQVLAANGLKPPATVDERKVKGTSKPGSGFRRLLDSEPVNRYFAVDPEDEIDVRLEEFYNTTGSAIPFRRINTGFYKFGSTTVQLDVIARKLMAKTEDGWNRGKFGPIDRFLQHYENLERSRAGIRLF